MTEEIKAIGERIRGLRDTFNVTCAQLALDCGLSESELSSYEKGAADISVGTLHTIAKRFGVELTTLLTGDEPHLRGYCLTRRDSGVNVNRRLDYQYKSLAYNFADRRMEPFMVTVEPKAETVPVHLNTHAGQEFDFVLSGKLLIRIDGNDFVLTEGDSLYFNSGLPHGMKALDGKSACFLAAILV